MDDVFVHKVMLPPCVKGVTVERGGDYIIIINEALSRAEQIKAVRHEMKHIRKGHLHDRIKSAMECEQEV